MTLLPQKAMKRRKESRTQDEQLQMNITRGEEKSTALVFSGGGGKSIFQAQIVKRLREADFTFDIMSGISGGALNAALMSQRNDNTVELWKDTDSSDLFSGGFKVWRLIKLAFGIENSIFDADGLEGFIRNNYNPTHTDIPFIVGTVNLQTAEYTEFEIDSDSDATSWRKEEIYDAIMACGSIPVLFPPIKQEGEHHETMFANGGIRNICPLSGVIKRDVDEILVITTTPRHLGTVTANLDGAFEIAERSFDILLNEVVREDIDSVLKVNRLVRKCGEDPVTTEDGKIYRHIDISLIEPRFGLGSMLDFSDSSQKRRINEANEICDRIIE